MKGRAEHNAVYSIMVSSVPNLSIVRQVPPQQLKF
jgi:hypothetical protein